MWMIQLYVMVALLATGCTYQPSSASGDNDGGSPDGVVVLGDADPNVDAEPPPDGQTAVVLDQSASQTVSIGAAVYCGSAALTRRNSWWRVFRPADFGVPASAPLHVTRVLFASEKATAATIDITVATYSGTYDAVTLDTSKLSPIGSLSAGVSGVGAQSWIAPLPADVPAGAMVAVQIDGTDRDNAAGGTLEAFHLGANHAGDVVAARSYHSGCGSQAQGVGTDIILRLEGTY